MRTSFETTHSLLTKNFELKLWCIIPMTTLLLVLNLFLVSIATFKLTVEGISESSYME